MDIDKPKIDSFIKLLNQNSGILAFGTAVLGFAVAYAQVIILSHGQTHIANYVITQVGLTQLWMNSLIIIAGAAINSTIFSLVAKHRGDLATPYGWPGSMVILGVSLVIFPLIYIFALIPATLIGYLLVRFTRKSDAKKRLAIKKSLGRSVFLSYITLGIFFYPNLPLHSVELKNESIVKSYVIAEKEDYLVVISNKPKKIQEIQKKDIIQTQLCSEHKPWPFYNLANVIKSDTRLLDECPKD